MQKVFAGVELGGTKIVCGLATADAALLERDEFPTGKPDETLDRIVAQIHSYRRRYGTRVPLGVASFGPLRLDRAAKDYGRILRTPKSGWSGTDLLSRLARASEVPIGMDTDVGAAAIAETRWGAGIGCRCLVYVTVGTGIGGGIIVDNQPLHGILHPELGHIRIQRAASDSYRGGCPFHADCLEGLAAGPAIEARWGRSLGSLPLDHQAYHLEAFYLAQMAVNIALTVAPERIVLGGGVMRNEALLTLVRRQAIELLNGYAAYEALAGGMERLIVAPALGSNAGLLGAIALAIDSATVTDIDSPRAP